MRLSPALAALGWLVAACTSLDSQRYTRTVQVTEGRKIVGVAIRNR